MPIGTKITVIISRDEDGNFAGVDSVNIGKFNHIDSFTTTYTVKRNDLALSAADSFIVTTNWAEGDTSMPIFQLSGAPISSPPVTPVTVLASDAIDKVNAVFPGTFE